MVKNTHNTKNTKVHVSEKLIIERIGQKRYQEYVAYRWRVCNKQAQQMNVWTHTTQQNGTKNKTRHTRRNYVFFFPTSKQNSDNSDNGKNREMTFFSHLEEKRKRRRRKKK